jgi:lipoyl(octanoyl) transferase
VEVRELGRVPYARALEVQQILVQRRRAGSIPDQLLLLEHPHVITLGSSSLAEHVLIPEDRRAELGIELFEVGRGGDVTYHGPGQLVGYPILDLKPDRKDVHRYLRDLEEVLIRALHHFGLRGERMTGLTGVWVKGRKIGAIGVRISSGWIASHGFALNVSPDLEYFDSIVPCGIEDREVTSISRALGRPVSVEEALHPVIGAFEEVFDASATVVPATISHLEEES